MKKEGQGRRLWYGVREEGERVVEWAMEAENHLMVYFIQPVVGF